MAKTKPTIRRRIPTLAPKIVGRLTPAVGRPLEAEGVTTPLDEDTVKVVEYVPLLSVIVIVCDPAESVVGIL